MKAYHDKHIISKNIKKGDLVLVYTLKQHLGKFEKRGYGPCIVEETSPSGAVKLAMLDGKQMSSWISGCRIKKYKVPLTIEMLQRLHSAKNKKERAELIKDQPRVEAKERMCK